MIFKLFSYENGRLEMLRINGYCLIEAVWLKDNSRETLIEKINSQKIERVYTTKNMSEMFDTENSK